MRAPTVFAACLVLAASVPAGAADLGTLDSSFGTAGIARYAVPNGYLATALAVQPDRKLVIAGGLYDTSTDYGDLGGAVLRALPDGALDPDFADGGVFTLFEQGILSNPRAVAVQPDGAIVVLGDHYDLVRLTAAGTPDPSFGTNGRRQIALGFGAATNSNGLVRQSDGKLVIAGFGETTPNDLDVVLVRLDEHGELDPEFGTGGVVTTDFPLENGQHGFDIGSSIVIQPDGKLVVAGSMLARYLTDGRLDPTFTNGDLRGPYGLATTDLALDRDGGLLAPCDGPISGEDVGICRFDATGNPDSSFGDGGRVSLTALSGGTLTGGSLARIGLQPDGRILLTATTDHHAVVLRVERDGRLDQAFGAGGVSEGVTSSFGAVFTGVGWQPEAGIVTVGIADVPFLSARYAASTCGNAVREIDEACDDGNADESDGCDSSCRASTCGATVCGPCETCDTTRTCVAAPRPSCREASAAMLRLAAASGPSGRHLRWQWRGTAPLPDAATPRPYTFCAYADEGTATRTLVALTAPADCGEASCWRRSAKRHVFLDPTGTSGIRRLMMQAERRGGLTITLRAGGPQLTLPPLPLTTPLLTQLVAPDRCWEARFDTMRTGARQLRAVH